MGKSTLLRAIRLGASIAMSWASEANAATYALYPGTAKGSWPPPLVEDLPDLTSSQPDVPTPLRLCYYRVAEASCTGVEGP